MAVKTWVRFPVPAENAHKRFSAKGLLGDSKSSGEYNRPFLFAFLFLLFVSFFISSFLGARDAIDAASYARCRTDTSLAFHPEQNRLLSACNVLCFDAGMRRDAANAVRRLVCPCDRSSVCRLISCGMQHDL